MHPSTNESAGRLMGLLSTPACRYGPGDLEKQKPGDYCTFRAEVIFIAAALQ